MPENPSLTEPPELPPEDEPTGPASPAVRGASPDKFEVAWEGVHCAIVFTDLFGHGESYEFGSRDAKRIADALLEFVADVETRGEPRHVKWGRSTGQ